MPSKKEPDPAENGLPDIPAPSSTRPAHAVHRASRRNGEVQRYTVDLDREQRKTLALCAAEWDVDKSRVIRTLLYLLESDSSLRERVQQELFSNAVE